ncbi:diacylglycerol kinase [Zhouia sp. PK063]|uniref:diacylglycerol kinase n=1 Tax=Zhouia sp. PK063 TaxID=3373602 RepID=UPI003798A19D
MPNFIQNRIKAFGYALKGAYLLCITETHFTIQLIIGVIMIIMGIIFHISKTEWCLQILTTGLVLSAEGLNTAIEKLADVVSPAYHKKIEFVKDASAGAVLIASLTAVVIGLFIYIPKIF